VCRPAGARWHIRRRPGAFAHNSTPPRRASCLCSASVAVALRARPRRVRKRDSTRAGASTAHGIGPNSPSTRLRRAGRRATRPAELRGRRSRQRRGR
jgi:hypothetical protein